MIMIRGYIARRRFARFLAVGAVNTITNFVFLNLAFFVLGFSKLLSIVMGTATAIIISFLLNRSFVFKDKSRPFKKFIMFINVATIGTFAIQTFVFIQASNVVGRFFDNNVIVINISNLLASFFVLFWNYNGYKYLVFRKPDQNYYEKPLSEPDATRS